MKTNVEFSGSIGSSPVNVGAKVMAEIDWEQRRWELVKEATRGLCSNSAFDRNYEMFSSQLSWPDYYAENAVLIANAVLEEYKKQSK